MYREFDHIDLGGTLYCPATNKNLLSIAHGDKFDGLKSVVFCLEDAIEDDALNKGVSNIKIFLQGYQQSSIKVFIRPKNPDNLKTILSLNGIEKIDGFSLAKFGTTNMNNYFEFLNKSSKKYHIMPVIESSDIFDINKLKSICDFLLDEPIHNIITLRVGGEDILKTLGLKKECSDSIHDFHISSKLFGDLFAIFKPYQFNITAPVYNCLENDDFFKAEVKRDLKEGFFGKTLIHPKQVKMINDLYKVLPKEYQEAKAILGSNRAIFRFDDKMCEPKVHNIWAKTVVKRANVYGICNKEMKIIK